MTHEGRGLLLAELTGARTSSEVRSRSGRTCVHKITVDQLRDAPDEWERPGHREEPDLLGPEPA